MSKYHIRDEHGSFFKALDTDNYDIACHYADAMRSVVKRDIFVQVDKGRAISEVYRPDPDIETFAHAQVLGMAKRGELK